MGTPFDPDLSLAIDRAVLGAENAPWPWRWVWRIRLRWLTRHIP